MKRPKVKMGPFDFTLFCCVMMLVLVGVVMVFSASSYIVGHGSANDYTFYLRKQLLWAVIGTVAMMFVQGFDYRRYKKLTVPFMLLSVVLLLVVFAFPEINGARRWINLGVASFQPSDFAKYIVVLYMAKSIDNKGENIKSLLYGIIPYIFVSGVYAFLILKEKNLSMASVIIIVTLIMLFAAGAKFRYFLFLLPVAAGAGYYFTVSVAYRMRRLLSFMNPFKDRQGDGFQLVQSLLALGSGGILGVGLGQSRQKCYYLPEPHNDFIFSVIGEELGFIGCTIIIIIFAVLIWRGIRVAIHAKDTFGTLLATGITSIIAVQAIINIAVVTGSMPVTGVTLPFISYGGSSLVINMMAMGVLLNISRQNAA